MSVGSMTGLRSSGVIGCSDDFDSDCFGLSFVFNFLVDKKVKRIWFNISILRSTIFFWSWAYSFSFLFIFALLYSLTTEITQVRKNKTANTQMAIVS